MPTMMREDFCAFILTHGRADRVLTYDTLRRCGYTGKVYIVIDDEDKQEAQYRAKYGDQVLQFSKAEIAKTFDEGDNFGDRRAIIYARNACWDLARQVGCRYFIQLDDDYKQFSYSFVEGVGFISLGTKPIKCLDGVWDSMLSFFESSNALSVAMSQSGDWIGGKQGNTAKEIAKGERARKAMNSFICSVERQFRFIGRINEDVNTYAGLGLTGSLFFTCFYVALHQMQTQQSTGGMSDLYMDSGTYVKSFYTSMYAPSCSKVKMLQTSHSRLHHCVKWGRAVPKILRETHRKPR
jgi:hypothetical protein